MSFNVCTCVCVLQLETEANARQSLSVQLEEVTAARNRIEQRAISPETHAELQAKCDGFLGAWLAVTQTSIDYSIGYLPVHLSILSLYVCLCLSQASAITGSARQRVCQRICAG